MHQTLMTRMLILPAVLGAFFAGCSQHHVPDVQVAPRASWADAEPIADRLTKHTPERLTIHHAGVTDDGSVPGTQKMRNLLRFSQRDKPWGDVPYHFVIDRQGNIWEGRALQYAPDTNTGYDVTGHVGICVNGDLTKQPLLEAQYRALVDLLVKLSADWNIADEHIAGHMDFSPGGTSCPGALEHYIRDGTLQENMRVVRQGQRFSFIARGYQPDAL
jgi:hypothetical protein